MLLSATEIVLCISLLLCCIASLSYWQKELICHVVNTLFLKISELSQQKLFFDTALAMPEEALLLVMSMFIFHIPSQCGCASKTQ